MEGYGPSGKALVELKDAGRRAWSSRVDCGAQAFDALDEAKAAGLDVIVVDHHQCASRAAGRAGDDQPQPPRRKRGWRGARPSRGGRHGVPARRRADPRAARARLFRRTATSRKIIDLLDLVALGTVADVARLKTLNRAFVTQGLKVMAGAAAISALPRWPRRRGWSSAPSCRDLGFALGPRINAGGRVGKSDLGVRLLTADRSRGSADHRRRARPPERGAAGDRDAGHRTGRGAGRRRRPTRR